MTEKCLILLVGAPRFELGTPSPPDWCANRAALRSDEKKLLKAGVLLPYRVRPRIAIGENRSRKVPKLAHRIPKNSRSIFALCSSVAVTALIDQLTTCLCCP
jgi:hypothetical protein